MDHVLLISAKQIYLKTSCCLHVRFPL